MLRLLSATAYRHEREENNSGEGSLSKIKSRPWLAVGSVLGGLAVAAVGTFIYCRYHISSPSQVIARTGMGIPDLQISKHGLQYPFQRVKVLDISPKSFHVDVETMSEEKLQFKLPFALTLEPDPDALTVFAKKFPDGLGYNTNELVEDIIAGECRSLAGLMKVNDIFNNRKLFGESMTKVVADHFLPFGLRLRVFNLRELDDQKDSKYFFWLRQKASSVAVNLAKTEVATAERDGTIGESLRKMETRKETASLESQAVERECQRNQEMVAHRLSLRQKEIAAEQTIELQKLEMKQMIEERKVELQKKIEIRRAEQERERLYADVVVPAEIQAMSTIKLAEAALAKSEMEAKGIAAVGQADAQRLQWMVDALGGNPAHAVQLQLMKSGIIESVAASSAAGLKDMKPSLNVWGKDESATTSMLQGLSQLIPPAWACLEQRMPGLAGLVNNKTPPSQPEAVPFVFGQPASLGVTTPLTVPSRST